MIFTIDIYREALGDSAHSKPRQDLVRIYPHQQEPRSGCGPDMVCVAPWMDEKANFKHDLHDITISQSVHTHRIKRMYAYIRTNNTVNEATAAPS